MQNKKNKTNHFDMFSFITFYSCTYIACSWAKNRREMSDVEKILKKSETWNKNSIMQIKIQILLTM